MCNAFLEGICEDGDDCKFSHEAVDGAGGATPQSPLAKAAETTPTEESSSPSFQDDHTHRKNKSLSVSFLPDDEQLGARLSSDRTPRPRSMGVAPFPGIDFGKLFANAESP